MKETKEELRQRIGEEAYQVTQNAATERAFTGKYDEFFEDVEWICVSLGANGAIVKHNKNFYKANIPQITVANPVGSGDSTLAGLAIAIDEKRDVSEVIKYGMTMGMLNTMEKKTGYIDMNKFEEFYNKIDVISL